MKSLGKLIYIIGGISVAFLVIFSFLTESESTEDSNTIQSDTAQYSEPNQVGYFKAENNSRVFTFTVDRRMPASEVENHAKNQMHSANRLTYAFYYYNNAPDPTTVNSLDRALQITENSDFQYSFMKMGDGSETFTDHR